MFVPCWSLRGPLSPPDGTSWSLWMHTLHLDYMLSNITLFCFRWPLDHPMLGVVLE
jgi:hypothetical protein